MFKGSGARGRSSKRRSGRSRSQSSASVERSTPTRPGDNAMLTVGSSREVSRMSRATVGQAQARTISIAETDWLRILEERFANALVADLLAATLGVKAESAAQKASAFVEEYLAFIRTRARSYAKAIIDRGDWSAYTDLLVSMVELFPPMRVPPRRGRPPKTPSPKIVETLRKYDEIMLHFQMMKPRQEIIRQYAGDLSDAVVIELSTEKDHLVAGKLAVRGTNIPWKTLVFKYADKYKEGRLNSITNDLGSWDRHGKYRRSFSWKRAVDSDGVERDILEPERKPDRAT